MKIDDNPKGIANKSFKGTFPQRGEYFYVTRSDGIRDYSFVDDIFKCDGSDPVMVVARCLTDLRTEQFRLNRNHYTFLPVSEEVLNAVGVYSSPEDTLSLPLIIVKEIVKNENNEKN